MVDLSQTATAVHLHPGATPINLQAGEAGINPGEPVRSDGNSPAKYLKAVNSGVSEAKATHIASGYAPALNDHFSAVKITDGQKMDLGGTLTVGETYCVSNTAGKIAPIGDIGTGEYLRILGKATAADELEFIEDPSDPVLHA